MKILILPRNDYYTLYRAAFVKPTDIAVTALEREWERLGKKLRASLGKHWEENCFGDKDFAISDDWAEAFHHCGSIYSDGIMCPLYAEIVATVLGTMKHKARWTYHTAVEPRSNKLPCGQFFIRDSVLYAPEDTKLDYRATFGRK